MAEPQPTPPAPGTTPGGAAAPGGGIAQPPQGMTMETLLMKERELAAKSAELAKRDREVRLALAAMAPNWPRKTCCLDPIVYHNIQSEVPVDRVGFVSYYYYSYFFICLMLVYNMVCSLVTLVTDDRNDASDDAKDKPWEVHLAISIVYLIGILAAFFCWYFPVYQAVSTFDQGKYKMAYVGMSICFLFDVFVTLGFVGYGGSGFFYGFGTGHKVNDTPKWMCIVNASLWCCHAIYMVWVFIKVRRYAKIDRNRTMADRVKNAVSSVVSSATGIPAGVL